VAAQALVGGVTSAAHARVLADGTRDLPDHVAAEADPLLVEAARRLDPPRLRQVSDHLLLVADPDRAEALAERRHQRRGCGWPDLGRHGRHRRTPGGRGRPHPAGGPGTPGPPRRRNDPRSGRQRTADALTELARRTLEGGRLPKVGGVRPQLTVTVDLDSLLGHPGGVGEEASGGAAGPSSPPSAPP